MPDHVAWDLQPYTPSKGSDVLFMNLLLSLQGRGELPVPSLRSLQNMPARCLQSCANIWIASSRQKQLR